MTELLVGTKKGLFVLAGEDSFEVTTRQFAGEPVEYAMRDRHSGRYFAAMISPFYGPKLLYTDDPTGTAHNTVSRFKARTGSRPRG